MKRLIIITIILLIATVLVTVVYFKNLNSTTQQTSQVLRTIPNNASLIFEFNNEKSFYDIFADNKLFANIIGDEKMAELAALKKTLLQNPLIEHFLNEQNLYVSLHPQKGDNIDFLLTIAVSKEFGPELFEKISKQPKSGIVINTYNVAGKQGYIIYLNDLKKRFYLIDQDDNTLSGSFSKDLIETCAKYDYKNEKQAFVLLPDRQSVNSLVNLYVNYEALSPLFEQLFINKNTDIFKSFRQLPAFAALSLNYKSDVLMFNGSTRIQNNKANYLELFSGQLPVANRIKSIFPSTTAYSTNFAVSDPKKFESDLSDWQKKGDFKTERSEIINKIKSKTGISLVKEFTRLLSNEFAIVTTRYHEKIAIAQVTDGSKMRSMMINLSKMNNDNVGQLNYEKLPQLLLGDAFSIFRRPYFRVMDNYLVLTNSMSEMSSYNDSYVNHKFISKTEGYDQFDGLLAERSNVSFFIQFKNAQPLFKQDMNPAFYNAFESMVPGWKNFYAAAWQFTSSDKNYYTNFCMRLNSDTTSVNTF
ncbi:hypothetical protein ACPPVU_17405 [Mucilaginibacter sp. McL0603]|uniref:hypothetical protein n=1 Tax=Mucilaginibacter sp. McL0603 TaxID=3415670 RepID=UPI003CFA10E4